MISNEIPSHLEALVDHLRKHKDRPFSLIEIASVTEVLIGTMSTYFKALDTTMLKEFRYLSEFITRARDEISQLQPSELKSRQIPRAGRELDAIVQATEEATNTIMEAAETIMAADASDSEDYANTVNECVMSIFEACSFQDITGQRISKVVETLSVIEQRLHRIGEVWGVEEGQQLPPEEVRKTSEDDPGMSGPALAGEGIDQDDVDALLQTGGSIEASAQQAADDIFAQDNDGGDEDVDATNVAPRRETTLSDDDVNRLMGAEEGPANDPFPAKADSRTAEQLVRAVESLLAEEADEDAENVIDAEKRAIEQSEDYALIRPKHTDEAGFVNGEKPAKRAAASGGAKAKTTTQADIDALFS